MMQTWNTLPTWIKIEPVTTSTTHAPFIMLMIHHTAKPVFTGIDQPLGMARWSLSTDWSFCGSENNESNMIGRCQLTVEYRLAKLVIFQTTGDLKKTPKMVGFDWKEIWILLMRDHSIQIQTVKFERVWKKKEIQWLAFKNLSKRRAYYGSSRGTLVPPTIQSSR